MSLLGAIATVASSLIGSYSAKSTAAAQASAASNLNAETMAFNSREAQTAREFENDMAFVNASINETAARAAWDRTMQADNTSHQREVADLRAAGLNPILSSNNGSSGLSSPMGSTASSAAPAASFGGGALAQQQQLSILPSLVSSAASMLNAETQAKKVDSDIKVNEQSIKKSISDVKINDAMISKIKAETGNIKKQASLIENQILESIGKQNLNREQIKAIHAGVVNQTKIANAQVALNHWQGVAAQASASHSYAAASEANERVKTYSGQIAHAKQEAKAYEGSGGTAWYYFNAAASKVASLLK